MSKPVVLKIDNVRVVRFNNMNYAVERYEDTFVPQTKQYEKRWVFKGYGSTILRCLEIISRNEMLINLDEINHLKDYKNQVVESNNKILSIVKGTD